MGIATLGFRLAGKPGKFLAALSISVLAGCQATTGTSDVTTNPTDRGGRMVDRMVEIERIIERGTLVRLNGDCVSACTMYLKLLATNQVCYLNSRAKFYFHWPRIGVSGEPYQSTPLGGRYLRHKQDIKIKRVVRQMHPDAQDELFRTLNTTLLSYYKPSPYFSEILTEMRKLKGNQEYSAPLSRYVPRCP